MSAGSKFAINRSFVIGFAPNVHQTMSIFFFTYITPYNSKMELHPSCCKSSLILLFCSHECCKFDCIKPNWIYVLVERVDRDDNKMSFCFCTGKSYRAIYLRLDIITIYNAKVEATSQ